VLLIAALKKMKNDPKKRESSGIFQPLLSLSSETLPAKVRVPKPARFRVSLQH
jgi:hypothetical protein